MSTKNTMVRMMGFAACAALAAGCATQPPPRVAEGSITGESVEEILASTSSAAPRHAAVSVAEPEQTPFGSTEYDVSFTPSSKERVTQEVAVSVPLQSSFLSKRERLRAAEQPVVPSTTW